MYVPSPRPERFTSRIWSFAIVGAMRVACAIAWLDSRAGMMPSMRQQSWNAFSASSSVMLTYRRGGCPEIGMLGADARIVEARADRMRLDNLAVFVLQQIGAIAVQHAGHALRERRRMPPVAIPSPRPQRR